MRVRLKFRGAKMNENYSWRKRYQRGYGEESASPLLKEYLDSMENRPNVIERHDVDEKTYDINRKIKREGTTPITKEELEWRHKELRKMHKDKPTGRIINWWRDLKGHYE